MKEHECAFVPLLFAGDINVYSMARSFHEIYGIRPYVYGKYPSGPCFESKIMYYNADIRIDQQDAFMATVCRFAEKHQHKIVLLIGCGDNYVRLISKNMDRLPDNVIAPYISIDLMNQLIHKEKFYELCCDHGIDFPATFIHTKDMGKTFNLPFDGPFIIKPSNGIEYWMHPFPMQKKVYKVNTFDDVVQILTKIYNSGYTDSVIIQDFIPGDDTFMRVLTCYSDQTGKVKLMCLGHVLLEEHTPRGIGNHAVIITERNPKLEDNLRRFLENIEYVGFSNFDIKYDKRDGKYKVFEINTRQGRSNYYVTGAGANLAQYVVEDWIYRHPIDFRVVEKEVLWLVIPKRLAFKYVKDPECKRKMKKLMREGKIVNPLYYKEDRGIKRKYRLFRSQLGHYYKFKKYM